MYVCCNVTDTHATIVIAWVAVKFSINTTIVALKFSYSLQQEWYVFIPNFTAIPVLFLVNAIPVSC